MDAELEGLQPTPEVLGRILRGESPRDAREDLDETDEDLEGRTVPDDDEGSEETGDEDLEADGDEEAEDGEGEPGTGDGEEEGGDPETMSFRKVAEQLGVSPKDLYQQLVVTLPDNRGDVTLSELKAGYVEHARLEDKQSKLQLEREEFQAERFERESEELRNRQDMARLMPYVKNLDPKLVAEAAEAQVEELRSERMALLGARPEWKDPGRLREELDRLGERAAMFGISRAEWANCYHHKLILAMDRLDTLEREREEVLSNLRKAQDGRGRKAPGKRRSSRGSELQRVTKAAAASPDMGVKAKAVARLLNSQGAPDRDYR